MPLRQFSPCNAGAIHRRHSQRPLACLKRANIRLPIKPHAAAIEGGIMGKKNSSFPPSFSDLNGLQAFTGIFKLL
jgi:hypothetical protein